MSGPMKTDDLIALIAADAKAPAPKPALALAAAWTGGLLASLCVFIETLGVRPDLVHSFESWRFLAKVLLTWAAVGISAWDCVRLMRPTETAPMSSLNWAIAGLVIASLVLEMTTVPTSEWAPRLMGQHWPSCLTFIPTLAMAPLIAAFLAFRSAAPASPRAAGAALGRLAAATGAGLYALHCPDDSPFFVMTWYAIAASAVIAVATVAGARLLRW